VVIFAAAYLCNAIAIAAAIARLANCTLHRQKDSSMAFQLF
jgi:hypothetical protein